MKGAAASEAGEEEVGDDDEMESDGEEEDGYGLDDDFGLDEDAFYVMVDGKLVKVEVDSEEEEE